ncbi:DoxX family membrane protein [Parapedobacter sp. SGR-10]|uniref:DoxX family membrane protein n=1 Tax=Parapedobacter sp. SGR-10 TaxID=2710879 RepID=UPI0013D8B1B0|nr:DoxX family membrane protein [Parapedobacter sp. SGR-10]NGF56669.1 DoxX family membrane protein [Parapedobacter sp. SGR-10]
MKQKILLVACILFALIMVNSGLNKFFNYMPAPAPSEEQMKIFGALMTLKWIIPLVAIVEIVGGLLLAVPKTRALGALIILPVTVGIVLHHLTFDVATIGIGLVLLAINVWVIIENKQKYEPILK